MLVLLFVAFQQCHPVTMMDSLLILNMLLQIYFTNYCCIFINIGQSNSHKHMYIYKWIYMYMFTGCVKWMLQLLSVVFLNLDIIQRGRLFIVWQNKPDLIYIPLLLWERRAAVVNSSVFTQCNESSINIREGYNRASVWLLLRLIVCGFVCLCVSLGLLWGLCPAHIKSL